MRTPDYAHFTRLETASAQVPADAFHLLHCTLQTLFCFSNPENALLAAVFAQAYRLLCSFLSSNYPSYTYVFCRLRCLQLLR